MKKKWLLVISVAIVTLAVTIGGFKVYSSAKETDEFVKFREYLDTEYFPLFKDFSSILEEATSSDSIVGWYSLELDNFEKMLDIKMDLEDAKEKITAKDMDYDDSKALKKQILENIDQKLFIIGMIESYANDLHYETSAEDFDAALTAQIEKLSEGVEQQNKIIEEYYN